MKEEKDMGDIKLDDSDEEVDFTVWAAELNKELLSFWKLMTE